MGGVLSRHCLKLVAEDIGLAASLAIPNALVSLESDIMRLHSEINE